MEYVFLFVFYMAVIVCACCAVIVRCFYLPFGKYVPGKKFSASVVKWSFLLVILAGVPFVLLSYFCFGIRWKDNEVVLFLLVAYIVMSLITTAMFYASYSRFKKILNGNIAINSFAGGETKNAQSHAKKPLQALCFALTLSWIAMIYPLLSVFSYSLSLALLYVSLALMIVEFILAALSLVATILFVKRLIKSYPEEFSSPDVSYVNKTNFAGGIIPMVGFTLMAILEVVYLIRYWYNYNYIIYMLVYLTAAILQLIFTVNHSKKGSVSLLMLKIAIPVTPIFILSFIKNSISVFAIILFIAMWVLTIICLAQNKRAPMGLKLATLITADFAFEALLFNEAFPSSSIVDVFSLLYFVEIALLYSVGIALGCAALVMQKYALKNGDIGNKMSLRKNVDFTAPEYSASLNDADGATDGEAGDGGDDDVINL